MTASRSFSFAGFGSGCMEVQTHLMPLNPWLRARAHFAFLIPRFIQE